MRLNTVAHNTMHQQLTHLHTLILNTMLKLLTNPPTLNLKLILMDNHKLVLTEHSFPEILANQTMTATMANAVPNGDTVELVIIYLNFRS